MLKKKGIRILLWVATGLVALAAVYCLLRFAFRVDVLDRSGWQTKNGTVRYLDYCGRPQKQWQQIEGERYYFLPEDGAMVTGWLDLEEGRYYFDEKGVCQTGWLQKDGKTYYLDHRGLMLTGWQTVEGKTCYFTENGAMTTGWLQKDGQTYYFDENGTMVTGWQEPDGHRMYFSPEGVLQYGWQKIDGKRFYLTREGYTVSGWVTLEDVTYRFGEDGSVVTGWFEDDSGRYYFAEDGTPCTGWLEWEQKHYYLQENGAVTTGWLTLEGDRYYFLRTGRMAIGEVEVDGVVRFFTSKGKEVLLCNPWHPVPEDYEMDLVAIEGYQVDRDARDPLQKMMDDCRTDGITCLINSAYRSKATQQAIWDRRVAENMAAGMSLAGAEAVVGAAVMIPGHSEHQTGLAIDIKGSYILYNWLGEHCWDYGFIIRYPNDRISITGIIYEPWHVRYVGTELSLELKALDLCMEEYMTMLTEQQSQIPD